MRRLIGLLVVAALAFYVAWPAWSAWRIAGALTSKDAAALDAKVDFPAVRESLRPAVTAELGKRIEQEMRNLGPLAGAVGGEIKTKMQGQLVEQALAALVTPETVIRIAHDGGDIAASVEKVLGDAAGQLGAVAGGATGNSGSGSGGGLGGILGQVIGAAGSNPGAVVGGGELAGVLGKALGGLKKPAETPVPAADSGKPAAKRSFGLGNIKSFRFAGPFAFNIAVARDAAKPTPDATVGMSFTGADWKLTRVVPNL